MALLKKLQEIFNKRVKKLHFYAGFAIEALLSLPFGYVVAFLCAVAAAAGKEIYDKVTGRGTPEVADFVCTIAGAITAVAFSVAVSFALNTAS